MPSIYREDGFRFGFFSNENNEPPHIHVKSAERSAKFWLVSIELVNNYGYTSKELGRIESIIAKHREEFLEKWNEYFRN